MFPSVLSMRLNGPEHFPQHVLEPKPTEAERAQTVKGDGVVFGYVDSDVLRINDQVEPFRVWTIPAVVLGKNLEGIMTKG